MQLADGACAFKTQTVVFCVKRRKAGRFFMQKAATKILKPLDKYNGGGGGYNESEQRFALRPEGRKCERGKTSKTMWRFLIMRLDMISRRRFLKSAGAAALAVAAAGVLAGCDGGDSSSKVPGTDTPNVPEVTSKQVKIIFADVDNGGAGIGNGGDYYEHPVLKDATVVDPKSIPADKIPQGYELADTTPVEIIDNGNTLLAIVKVKKTVDTSINVRVTLQLINGTAADNQRELVVKMPGDAAYISTDDITLPEDLIWAPGMEGEKRPIGRAIFLVKKV